MFAFCGFIDLRCDFPFNVNFVVGGVINNLNSLTDVICVHFIVSSLLTCCALWLKVRGEMKADDDESNDQEDASPGTCRPFSEQSLPSHLSASAPFISFTFFYHAHINWQSRHFTIDHLAHNWDIILKPLSERARGKYYHQIMQLIDWAGITQTERSGFAFEWRKPARLNKVEHKIN